MVVRRTAAVHWPLQELASVPQALLALAHLVRCDPVVSENMTFDRYRSLKRAYLGYTKRTETLNYGNDTRSSTNGLQ